MKTRNRFILVGLISTLLLPQVASAQVPNLVSYQGRVAVGTVNFEGTGQFKFALVNAAGTIVYWGSDADVAPADGVPDAAVPITVTKGLYSVLLGDTSVANMATIPASVWANGDVRLRVWFNDGVNGNQLLTPDQRLAPNGYIADGSVGSAALASGAVTSAKLAAGLTLGGTTVGTFSGNGSALTALDAANLSTGSVADARLSANVALRNVANTFTDTLSVSTAFVVQPRPSNTGANTLFIGNGAGAANTSGLQNTFMGSGAGLTNTTGGANAFVGSYAGRHNTTGSSLAFLGNFAGFDNTTGSFNTFLGAGAGQSNTTGIRNIALGEQAGMNLTTGSGNIAIGNAGVAAESNIIRIGTSQTDTFLTGIIHGNGSALTGLPAANLTGALPALNASALTNLGGANITAASIGSTQLASGLTLGGTTSGTFSGNGAALTSLNGASLTASSVTAAKLGSDVGLWSVNGGDVYRSGGRVGIGTSTPSQALDVNGNISLSGTHLVFNSGNGVIDWSGSLFFRTLSNQGDINSFTDRMTISGNGNVGIGTSSPSTMLDLAPADGTLAGIRLGGASATASRFIGITDTPTTLDANTGFSGIEFGGPGLSPSNPAGVGREGYVAFHTHDVGASSGERMRINKLGSVGIGTSTPAGDLEVSREGQQAEIYVSAYGGWSSVFAGRSAAGTEAAPLAVTAGYPLAFFGAQGYTGSAFTSGTNAVISMYAAQTFTPSATATNMAFSTTPFNTTTALERMRITSQGFVGIGTGTPSYLLHVKGTTSTAIGVESATAGTIASFALKNPEHEYALATFNGIFTLQDVTRGAFPLVVNSVGDVGIGTTIPNARLAVVGSLVSGGFNASYLAFGGGSFATVAHGPHNMSIYADNDIMGLGFYALSDERIKNIRGQSDSAADLRTLRDIQITDYRFKDEIGQGSGQQKKVIAQQVEKVFPQAVNQHTGVVPDIFKKAAIEDGWVALKTEVKKGDRVRLISEKHDAIHEVLEVKRDSFRTDFQGESKEVFVYGREVKDVRAVDYEAISMLNVSATQELARKVEAKDAELARLTAENAALKRQLADNDARDKAIEARLAAIEKGAPATTAKSTKVALTK